MSIWILYLWILHPYAHHAWENAIYWEEIKSRRLFGFPEMCLVPSSSSASHHAALHASATGFWCLSAVLRAAYRCCASQPVVHWDAHGYAPNGERCALQCKCWTSGNLYYHFKVLLAPLSWHRSFPLHEILSQTVVAGCCVCNLTLSGYCCHISKGNSWPLSWKKQKQDYSSLTSILWLLKDMCSSCYRRQSCAITESIKSRLFLK